MEANFTLTIILFFTGLIISGISGHYIKKKLNKKKRIIIGILSIVIGLIFVLPTLRAKGNIQAAYIMGVVSLANFGMIILTPEKELPHSIENNIAKKR